MFSTMRKLNIILVFGTILLGPSLALADDTEIYVGGNQGNTDVKPNIVFLIDTSGSMSTTVSQAQDTYDPSITYSGTCASDRVYWSTGTAPSCGTSRWFYATANKCVASQNALNSTGFFEDRMAMWNNSSRSSRRDWESFNTGWNDHYVECKADNGVHGDGVNTSNLYPASGSSGPWSSGSNKIDWRRSGSTYTIYSGNFLNWKGGSGAAPKSRLDIVKQVFTALMDSAQGINLAMMRFDSQANGGYFLTPMLELSDTPRADLGNKSSREYFKTVVAALTAGGNTPLAESLYEAGLFYRGAVPQYGLTSRPATSHSGCLDGANYLSPIDYQCQKNFIVLLTDGEPTSDSGADSLIKGLPGFASLSDNTCAAPDDNCLDEMAEYLYKFDQRSDLNDKQNVITYAVGFHTDQALLSETARKGSGKYYRADNTANLIDAFTSIITEILAVNTTFTAPAVSVNAFNRLTHRDELYFALFRPDSRPYWNGNIKRYSLSGDPLQVRDKNGNPAVDPNTGFFSTASESWWSTADGDDVGKGGAAGQLTLPRKVYTYTGSSTLLTDASNSLHESNAAVTIQMLNITTHSNPPVHREELLKWARGVDVYDDDGDGSTTDVRLRMGDPLHTDPVLVTYGGTNENPVMVLFGSTNEGYLHAITRDGLEVFSFMPQELLPNLDLLFENSTTVTHPYGLDGPITAWTNETPPYDGQVSGAGEHVYVYSTMRRGGRNIYALDVTNYSQPKLLWTITGGAGDFVELGQTWSRIIQTKVKWGGSDRNVLIFGGGYDTNQDSNTTVSTDAMGRAVFMVDATTGQKLWQAGPSGSGANLVLPEMLYSIPSEVRVIDITGDGYADRMYVGDMGGQLWRFDIKTTNAGANDFATAGILATVGDTTQAGNRRFYYPPDVSLDPSRDYLNIAIGSGYRAHPLDKVVHDAFFVIRDPDVSEAPKDASGNIVYTPIALADLYDATENIIGQGTGTEVSVERDKLATSSGFYIWLNSSGTWEGEKVLAESLTMDNVIIFTTFTPVASASASACAPSQGTGKVYYISATDGTPAFEQDNLDGLTKDDRSNTLTRGGIPPRPTPICTTEGCTVLIGPEMVDGGSNSNNPQRLYWQRLE